MNKKKSTIDNHQSTILEFVNKEICEGQRDQREKKSLAEFADRRRDNQRNLASSARDMAISIISDSHFNKDSESNFLSRATKYELAPGAMLDALD